VDDVANCEPRRRRKRRSGLAVAELRKRKEAKLTVREVRTLLRCNGHSQEPELLSSNLTSNCVHHLPHRLDLLIAPNVLPRRQDGAVLVLGSDENAVFEGSKLGEDVGLESGFEEFETGREDAAEGRKDQQRVGRKG
jgi:hypothetical protein